MRNAIAMRMLLLVAWLGCAAAALAQEPPANIVVNGDFEQSADGWFEAWAPDKSGRAVLVEQEGNRFIRFTLDGQGAASSGQRIALDPDWQFLDISVRIRGTDIRLGKQHWQTARLEYTFSDRNGRHVAGWPWLGLREDGSTGGWKTLRDPRMRIPPGAAYLNIAVGMWGAAGTADMDDVVIRPIEGAATLALKIDPRQADAVRNGDFARVDPETNLPEGWQAGADAATIEVVGDDAAGRRVRITRTGAGDSYLSQRFPVHPWWEQMSAGVEVGRTAGQGRAQFRYRFYDADGRMLGEERVDPAGEGEWKPAAQEARPVPPGTVEMEVLFGIFEGAGSAEFRRPHARPTAVERKPGETPKDIAEQWAAAQPQAISAHRGRIALDGPWLFQPSRGAAARAPLGEGWGVVRVPGSWHDGIVRKGSGAAWEFFDPAQVGRAWYRRVVHVPAEWEGRAVILKLDRVGTDARVWVNDSECGEIRWPAGSADITTQVKPGADNEIRILVVASGDAGEAAKLLGAEDEPAAADVPMRGLVGGVALLSRPRGAHVADVHVRPSTRQQAVEVDIELANVTRHGQLQVRAEMLDEGGEVEQTFEQILPVSIARHQKLTAKWPWEKPRLFDFGQPNRYAMRLSVSGPGFEDGVVRGFGFREFWIDGRRFFLNGREIRLRPASLRAGDSPKGYLDRGYNYVELRPADRGRRGAWTSDDQAIAEADAAGILVGVPLVRLDEETRDEGRRLIEQDVRRWRNSPSVVMWHQEAGADVPAAADPRQLAAPSADADVAAIIRTIDPTRPIYAHDGGGDVRGVRLHLGFAPLQEREEWLSAWARDGQAPLMAVELGMPSWPSFFRAGETAAEHSEPLLSEWCAVYLGPEAYRAEPAEYRKLIVERCKGEDPQGEYQPAWTEGDAYRVLAASPAYRKLVELFAVNTWRSWRTMGITGGMAPWQHDDADDVPSLRQVNGPSLAWIAGPGGPPVPGEEGDAFTAKDHSFSAGQGVRKQLVLINDHRDARPATYEWKAVIGDQTIAGGKSESPIELAPAETRFVPVELKLPEQLQGEKAAGRIELVAKIGPDEHRDAFAFEVFAPIPPAAGVVTIFDPVGDTAAMLKSLGYELQRWDKGNPTGELLVIGRKALSDGHRLPGEIQTYLANGGRIIVMGQDPRWVRHALGLRTSPHLSRRVFRVSGGHPVVVGLDDNDLRDWNGFSRMIEAYPEKGGGHWGNRGAVASGAVEKPHRSGLRPLLECEFDLAFSPLMEMEYGRGRLLLCMLDLEDHAADTPAARKLARQVFEYARTASITPKAERVVYLGGADDAKTLDLLGVKYEQTDTLDRPADLLILGRGATIEDSMIASLAGQGARVLVMRHDEAGAGRLGAEYQRAGEYAGTTEVPDWFEARGLSASDLRWRAVGSAVLIKDGNEKIQRSVCGQIGKMPVGQGLVIFAQVDPGAVPPQACFRYTRWRQTRALAQLLANLGASFTADDQLVQRLERPAAIPDEPATRPAAGIFYHPDCIDTDDPYRR